MRTLQLKVEIGLHNEIKGLAKDAYMTQGDATIRLITFGIAAYRAQVKALKEKESREKVYEEDYQI